MVLVFELSGRTRRLALDNDSVQGISMSENAVIRVSVAEVSLGAMGRWGDQCKDANPYSIASSRASTEPWAQASANASSSQALASASKRVDTK